MVGSVISPFGVGVSDLALIFARVTSGIASVVEIVFFYACVILYAANGANIPVVGFVVSPFGVGVLKHRAFIGFCICCVTIIARSGLGTVSGAGCVVVRNIIREGVIKHRAFIGFCICCVTIIARSGLGAVSGAGCVVVRNIIREGVLSLLNCFCFTRKNCVTFGATSNEVVAAFLGTCSRYYVFLVLFALSTLVDNVIVAILDGVIAVCYLVGIGAVICVVSGVEVLEGTALNDDCAESFGFVNVEEVTVAKVILIGRECTTIDDDYALSGSIDACTATGCEGAVFNSNICTVGSGNYASFGAICAASHCAVAGDGYFDSFAASPKNVNNAVFVFPVGCDGFAGKVNGYLLTVFKLDHACQINVSRQLNAVACRENCLEIGFVGDFNGCAFFNDCNLIFALASGTIVENAVNDHILVSTVTGSVNVFGAFVAADATSISFNTLFGAGGLSGGCVRFIIFTIVTIFYSAALTFIVDINMFGSNTGQIFKSSFYFAFGKVFLANRALEVSSYAGRESGLVVNFFRCRNQFAVVMTIGRAISYFASFANSRIFASCFATGAFLCFGVGCIISANTSVGLAVAVLCPFAKSVFESINRGGFS